MIAYHLHLLPGFLGRPEDFSELLSHLQLSRDWHIHLHDPLLWSTSPDSGLELWARQVEAKMSPGAENFVLGYSLGGRVALHLDPDRYQKLFLLSVHPGLESGRSQRLEQDQLWAKKLLDQDERTWLESWNRQAVFQGDVHRPQRRLQTSRTVWAHLLRQGSLGNQNLQWDRIRTMAQKIFWLVGSRDEKFMALKSQWLEALPAEHVVEIAGSGHGLLFEAPAKVASVIRPWLKGDRG